MKYELSVQHFTPGNTPQFTELGPRWVAWLILSPTIESNFMARTVQLGC